jgi:bifunctional enzyme CysN/CysC
MQLIGAERFHLIYMDAGIEYCRSNKPELYTLAEEGKLRFLPGIDEVYEMPEHPALRLKPEHAAENIPLILQYLQTSKIFPLE